MTLSVINNVLQVCEGRRMYISAKNKHLLNYEEIIKFHCKWKKLLHQKYIFIIGWDVPR